MKQIIFLMSICLLTLSTSVSAQEATLDETFGFISRKLQNDCVLKYGNDYDVKSYFNDLNEIKYNNKTLLFGSSVSHWSESLNLQAHIIQVQLNNVETIEIDKGKTSSKIVMKSARPFVYYSKKNQVYDIYKVSNPYKLEIYWLPNEDAERVLKAFHHLFKLLNIKLVEEKF